MKAGLQAEDIVVIKDRCEECKQIVPVLRTGHLDKHKHWINRRWKRCPGSGILADTVILIYKADNRGTKKPIRRTSKRSG